MKDFRQVFGGILMALLSLALLVGSFNLALVEAAPRVAQAGTPTPVRSPSPTRPTTGSLSPGETPLTATETATLPPPPPTSACPVPLGWQTIIVQPGDTLESLAALYQVSREDLAKGNCLEVETLIQGTTIQVPARSLPTPTLMATSTVCRPPAGWVQYTVHSGDTLFGLSQIFGVSVEQIKAANCLKNNTIYINQKLFVPFLPPPPTHLPTRTPTRVPTSTIPPLIPSNTSSPTPTPSVPSTGTPTVVNPPTETPTGLPVPTHTATPPPTATDTPPPTGTPTPEPTATVTPVASTTPSSTTTPTP